MVNLWPQLWWWLQVKIQQRQFSLSILPRSWTPLVRAILKEGGRALLWPSPAVPPASSLGSSPSEVMTPRVVWASGQPWVMDLLSLSIFSSKAAAVARALQLSSLTSARSLSMEVPLLPLLGVLLLGGWMSARPGSSKPHIGLPSFCLRWSLGRTLPWQSISLFAPTPRVGTLVASWVYTVDSTGLWILPC